MLSTVGVDNGGGHAAWSVGGSTHTRPDGTTLCLACIDVSVACMLRLLVVMMVVLNRVHTDILSAAC